MKHILRIRQVDKDIFKLIKSGQKKIETRAATPKFQKIKAGDRVEFVCDNKKLVKKVKKVLLFEGIKNLLKKYKVGEIVPGLNTFAELEKRYHSFPGYKEKIKEFGIISFELE